MRSQSKWLLLVFLAGGLIGAFFGRITAISDHPQHLGKFANQAEADSTTRFPGRLRDAGMTAKSLSERFKSERPLERAEMETLLNQVGTGSMSSGLTVTASAVENLSIENIDGAIQAMKNARDAGKNFGITERAIWEKIGEIDGARQLAQRMPEHPDDSPAWGVKGCVEGWALGDPEAAKTWYSSLPDGKWKTSIFGNLVTGLARKDPLETAKFVGSLPAEVQLSKATFIAYYLVQSGGGVAADRWIQNLEVTSGKAQAQKAFDSVYGRMIQDHSYAAEWLAGANAAPYFDETRQSRFASSWAKKEPDKAADWAVARGSQKCLSAVIASCPEENFSKLASWLGRQRGKSIYDEAAVAFANRIQSTDPESADQWRKSGSNK
jgi:hypothetical protein